MIRQDKFEVGDIVYFREEIRNNWTDNTKLIKEGPHKIIKIYNATGDCNGMGHTQLVYLEKSPNRSYSGWWFKPVR